MLYINNRYAAHHRPLFGDFVMQKEGITEETALSDVLTVNGSLGFRPDQFAAESLADQDKVVIHFFGDNEDDDGADEAFVTTALAAQFPQYTLFQVFDDIRTAVSVRPLNSSKLSLQWFNKQ